MSNYGIPNMSIYGYSPPEKASVPLNALILWYGSSSAVPAGWSIYSTAANNFIMGASAGAKTTTPSGANFHVHTNSTTGTAATHGHSAAGGTASGSGGTTIFSAVGQNVATTGHTHYSTGASVTNGGGHSHTTSDTESVDGRPPFHRLYWIERTA